MFFFDPAPTNPVQISKHLPDDEFAVLRDNANLFALTLP